MLRLVEYEKETIAAAAEERKTPDVSPTTPLFSSSTFKDEDTRRFLKSDATLVSEKGDLLKDSQHEDPPLYAVPVV